MLRYPPQLSHGPPISRTLQYKKITKPLLERKRRARINRCLEQLKDLMVGALEAEGENINKLEKADILELTVRHLHRITRPHDPTEEVQRFQAGFTQCASEACGFLLSLPGLDNRVGKRLVEHLGKRISQSLESNPSLLLGNIEGGSPHPAGYEQDEASAVSRRSLDTPEHEHFRLGSESSRSSQSSPQFIQSKPGTSNHHAFPNSLNPYKYAYFDSDHQSECNEPTGQNEAGVSSQEQSSKPIHRSVSTSSYLSGAESSSFPKLLCPQPTRPVVLSMSTERTLPTGFQSRRSMSPETSMSSIARSTVASLSNPVRSSTSMPSLLSPSISVSVSDIDSRLDGMAMSPGALSVDGSSSCHSEDMWRPW